MGTYSFYEGTHNEPAKCIINWEAMNKETLSGFWRFGCCYEKGLKTLQEVAEHLIESKLIGYMDEDLIQALVEFNRHLVPYGKNPSIFFSYEGDDYMYALEFIPGTDGFYLKRIRDKKDDYKLETAHWLVEYISR
jgi:hypothetical protein